MSALSTSDTDDLLKIRRGGVRHPLLQSEASLAENAHSHLVGAPAQIEIDQSVIDIAQFAISEYNKQQGTSFVFAKAPTDSIVSASVQVVAGTKHVIVVDLVDAKVTHRIRFAVWSQPWIQKRVVVESAEISL